MGKAFRIAISAIFAVAVHAAAGMQLVAGPIVKVSVSTTGGISVDGHITTLDGLKLILKEARPLNGTVYYYRENGQNPMTIKQGEIFKAVMDARLPIALSDTPDFSHLKR